ncbi:probable serine/threonine-protein kinase PkwA [Aspergillus udagawae]|nr:probable serine/threonine-protein kinase PkwA [Aspergillus udagawae]
MFIYMLTSKDLSPVYLVVDALGKCDQSDLGIRDLRLLISGTLEITNKVKCLLSSRPEVTFTPGSKLRRHRERWWKSNAQCPPEPVNARLNHKLLELERVNGYAQSFHQRISAGLFYV